MRQSGIELLRILAACSVVILHYHEIASSMDVGMINMFTLDFLESFAICAVDVFVAISGYFMIKSQKRTWGKALSLLFQVTLINMGILGVSVVKDVSSFSWNMLIQNLIPHNYFVILYVVMYFISPYVNLIINSLSQDGRKRFLIITIVLFSIYPTIVNISGNLLHITWFGLSSISAWGSQQGFTIVNFLLLYSIGACLRLETFKIKRSILPILVCGCLIFGWSLIEKAFEVAGPQSSWEYHNPLVVLMAILLMNYFIGCTFQSKVINNMAKAAFFCYLIHWKILMYSRINYFVSLPVYYMLAHLVILMMVCYFISWILYYLYSKLFGKLFERLDSFAIKYYN